MSYWESINVWEEDGPVPTQTECERRLAQWQKALGMMRINREWPHRAEHSYHWLDTEKADRRGVWARRKWHEVVAKCQEGKR